MKLSPSVRADLALAGVTLVWGSSFTIVKQALESCTPLLFIALRFLIATAATVALMPGALRGLSAGALRRGVLVGCFLLAGFVFQTLGLEATTPSKSAFITSLSVLLVPLLGFVFYRHRPRPQTLVGVALATAGLALLTLERLELRFHRGDLLTFACAVAFALHILLVGRYSGVGDYRQLVIVQIAASAAGAVLLAPLLETPRVVWSGGLTVRLLITGFLGTALGFYVQNRVQRLTTANRAALIMSLEPLFAVLFAWLLLGQVPTAREWAGGGLVLGGVMVAELRRA